MTAGTVVQLLTCRRHLYPRDASGETPSITVAPFSVTEGAAGAHMLSACGHVGLSTQAILVPVIMTSACSPHRPQLLGTTVSGPVARNVREIVLWDLGNFVGGATAS